MRTQPSVHAAIFKMDARSRSPPPRVWGSRAHVRHNIDLVSREELPKEEELSTLSPSPEEPREGSPQPPSRPCPPRPDSGVALSSAPAPTTVSAMPADSLSAPAPASASEAPVDYSADWASLLSEIRGLSRRLRNLEADHDRLCSGIRSLSDDLETVVIWADARQRHSVGLHPRRAR